MEHERGRALRISKLDKERILVKVSAGSACVVRPSPVPCEIALN